jgi:mercuric ion transport protein
MLESAQLERFVMNDKTLLKTGIVGSVIAAICCVTPILVVTVSALGFAAIVGWLDYLLLPALAFFLGLTGYALVRRRRAS